MLPSLICSVALSFSACPSLTLRLAMLTSFSVSLDSKTANLQRRVSLSTIASLGWEACAVSALVSACLVATGACAGFVLISPVFAFVLVVCEALEALVVLFCLRAGLAATLDLASAVGVRAQLTPQMIMKAGARLSRIHALPIVETSLVTVFKVNKVKTIIKR
ncbi:hypothetical protein BX661DRAFT_181978 [Kickxella alabastrina]|uniref:uncharacterized protein n=1 Tax=Kickxella alabastrina TaxID=61397 RepID=UPI0022207D0C|nr:uncharacterized protein BX661DRAFT_181978 [Kickxella alabastrina]KAI7828381.1 hypothetical protein BX661DRAFT_181978 [Kickxella alabastrina]